MEMAVEQEGKPRVFTLAVERAAFVGPMRRIAISTFIIVKVRPMETQSLTQSFI
jgi:hypothetical protein